MRRFTFARFAAALLLSAAVVAPGFAAARGKADFTRYFALGTSYGAGVSNGSVIASHQQYGYAADIARQAGLRVTTDCIGSTDAKCWQIPWVSEPGLGPEITLLSLSPLSLGNKAGAGSPINLGLARPYNNLSIPGSVVHDLNVLTGAQPVTGTATSTAQFILRGLGSSVDQMLSQHPTFITVDTGGNDVLGAVLNGSPAFLTPLASFQADFAALLDKLIAGAPDAGIVVMGIADVSALPFATTLPPILVDANLKPVIVGGNTIPLFADLGGGVLGTLPAGSLVTLNAESFLATGYGIPPPLASAIPLPNAGKPLPDGVVITPTELAIIQQRVTDVQAAIVSIAGARNIPVVDLHPLLQSTITGIHIGGITLTGKFLQGGFFGYDGFHPTDLGYALLANEWLKVINTSYGTHIPLASIAPFLQNNGPNNPLLTIVPGDPLAFRIEPSVTWMGVQWPTTTEAPAPTRRRASHN